MDRTIMPLAVFFSIIAVIISAAIFYQDKPISPFRHIKKGGAQKIDGVERMKVVLNVGDNRTLGMDILIPFEQEKQHNELLNKYPKIKNDIMNSQLDQIGNWAQTRDFKAIKIKIKEIINKNLNHPIKSLSLIHI